MSKNLSKDKILKKIQKALLNKVPKPFDDVVAAEDVFVRSDEELPIIFAEEFTKVKGEFIYCEDLAEFATALMDLKKLKGWKEVHCWDEDLQEVLKVSSFDFFGKDRDIETAEVGLTRCEALVARTGSILLSSSLASGRTLSVYPPVHVCVAYTNQLVYNIDAAMNIMNAKYGHDLPTFVSLATGPSRTADIEKTLVLGAHGPREVYLFLVEAPE